MKHLGILIFFIFVSLIVFGQEVILKDKVTMNTGEVYIGEILVKNNEMILLKTPDGSRYQFQLSEVKKMEKVEKELIAANTTKDSVNTIENNPRTGNLSLLAELSGGISEAKNCIPLSPNVQFSFIFGNKNVAGKKIFLGVGVGFNNTFVASNSSTISFLPVFIRLQSNLTKKRTTPFVGMDAGYAFALSSSYGGGALAKITVGISHRINYKTQLTTGIYTGVNAISGNQTETNELGTFSYYGNTTLITLGAKVGLQF